MLECVEWGVRECLTYTASVRFDSCFLRGDGGLGVWESVWFVGLKNLDLEGKTMLLKEANQL